MTNTPAYDPDAVEAFDPTPTEIRRAMRAPPVDASQLIDAAKTLRNAQAPGKLYRLTIKSTRARPAPVSSFTCDVGSRTSSGGVGATFAKSTSIVQENDLGQSERVHRPGNRQVLSDAEVAYLKARIRSWVVRWTDVSTGRAEILDLENGSVVVDASRDEPFADYLSIEPEPEPVAAE